MKLLICTRFIFFFFLLSFLLFSCSNKYDGLNNTEKHTTAAQLIKSKKENFNDDFSEAKKIYKLILKANPQDGIALNNIAFGYCKMYYHNYNKRNFDEAIKLLERAHEYANNQYTKDNYSLVCEGYLIFGIEPLSKAEKGIPLIWFIDYNLTKLYKIRNIPGSKQLKELEWWHIEELL